MPIYDAARYDPPAPVARVTLIDNARGKSIPDVPMLIDSGADVTLLPRASVNSLGVTPIAGVHVALLGFDGTKTTSDAVDLDMVFLRKAFRGRYLLIDDTHGVLGRDVLAAVALLLDGPAQEWVERTP
jgi:hypothetical protein